jgi:hypothetical protein
MPILGNETLRFAFTCVDLYMKNIIITCSLC